MLQRAVLLRNILGRLVYLACTSMMIWFAGGGAKFVRLSVGIVYMVLWNIWWVITFLGRQKGAETKHHQGQKWLVIVTGWISVPFLIIVPPLEYAHFSGPVPRAGPIAWIGLFFFLLGIVLQSISMWQLHSYFTVRLGVRNDQRLVTTGLYRWIRHPGYLSYLISILGIGLAMSSIATLVFEILIFLFISKRIMSEERMLLEAFGEQYAKYMRRTNKLFPGVY